MKEDLIHFAWKIRLSQNRVLQTTCGKKITIIREGVPNSDAGPDYHNALIRICGMMWAGNVEVHAKASDWYNHRHHLDQAYNTVILHVVKVDDRPVFNSSGTRIPAVEIPLPTRIESNYRSFQQENYWPACAPFLSSISRVKLQRWLTLLMSDRLEQKTNRVYRLMQQTRSDWNEILYRILSSGFGLPINCLPFELTAKSIPYPLLIRNSHNFTGLEAMLLGQAGFLQGNYIADPYPAYLYRSYRLVVRNLPTSSAQPYLWKFLRLRPASFPTLRLSQFASLINLRFPLLDTVLGSKTVSELEQLFRVCAGEYWNTHYRFGKHSPESKKYFGCQATHSLIINAIVPFLFSFGQHNHHPSAINQGTSLLHDLEPESNHIIEKWTKFGITPGCAFESQALIQLYNVYCKQKRCSDCQLGAKQI